MLNSINDIYYIKFSLQFVDMQIDDLVDSFNREVKNHGWVGIRAHHDRALIDDFIRRGIDVSEVYDGKTLSFTHHVKFDLFNNKLVTID